MRTWRWVFDPDADPPRSSIYISCDEEDERDFTAVMYTEPYYLDDDLATAQFIVDALNEKEQDDVTRAIGQRLIDATQAVIDEKERLLADINAELAEAVRRTEG